MTFFPKEESLKMSNCVMYVVFTCFGNTSDKEDAMKDQLTDLIAIEFLQKLVDLCHEFTGIATVSYTHLDVYKRQVWIWAKGFLS